MKTQRLVKRAGRLQILMLLSAAFFALTAESLSGQSRRITGTVTDDSGNPMAGVTVRVEGMPLGTGTSGDGSYTLSVPPEAARLIFSYLGFESKSAAIGNATVIDVTMEERTVKIDDVVVVGYGVQQKESSVAAISQIKGDVLLGTSASTVSGALAGQVPGISTVQLTGQPGEDASKIYIRGVSSWQGDNQPLVIVDGVERAFNQIDPNEIETLSVLKDASATAVFGVRGANGVILITTKRGKEGRVKVNFTSEAIIRQPIGVQSPMDSYNTGLVLNEAYKNDNNWGRMLSDEILEHYRVQDMPYVYPNTNWQDIILKDFGTGHKYNLNVSGGTEFARVFASLSYTHEGDIFKLNKMPDYDPRYMYDKYNYRFNIDTDITKTTTLSFDAGGYIGIKNNPFEESNIRRFKAIFVGGPMDVPAYYPESVLEEYPDLVRPDETGQRLATTLQPNNNNPLIANQYSGSRNTKTTNLNVNIQLNQKLDFITSGLRFTVKAAYNNTTTYQKAFQYNALSYKLNAATGTWSRQVGMTTDVPEGPEYPGSPSAEGLVTAIPAFRTWYLEAAVNYKRRFGEHQVTGLIVGQRRKTQSNVAFPSYEQGVAARTTYDYSNRYLFEGNLAYNGSEQFAPKNRYGLFPSVAVGWNLHNEPYFKSLTEIVRRLKVRASVGQVGSDASPNRWLYTSSYVNGNTGTVYMPGSYSSGGTTITSIVEEAAANVNAQWEIATKRDLGIELSLFKDNMVEINVDFFDEHRTGILLTRGTVSSLFGAGHKQQNLGETKTKGYEADIRFQQTLRSGLHYWVKGSISFSDNRILERDEPMDRPEYQRLAGKRIHQITGYYMASYVDNPDVLMNSIRYGSGMYGLGDSRWIDFNGDGDITELDLTPMGYTTRYPLYNYAFSGGFRYKNFDFDFLFQAVSHTSRIIVDNFMWPLHRLSNQAFDYQLDVWGPDNPNAQYPYYRMDANRGNNNINEGAAKTTSLYDASYIRLKTVNMGYTFPKRVTKKLGLDNLRIFLRGNNLFTWCPNYPLSDPEAGDPDNQFLSHGYYPMIRRINVGVNLSF